MCNARYAITQSINFKFLILFPYVSVPLWLIIHLPRL